MITMKLQPIFYEYMKNGTKRIELRLYDEKRQQIKLGDKILFQKEPDLKESFEATVTELLKYDSFKNLIDNIDMSLLASKEMKKEELLSELEKFYPIEKQKQYGVIGIRVAL